MLSSAVGRNEQHDVLITKTHVNIRQRPLVASVFNAHWRICIHFNSTCSRYWQC